MTHRQSGTVMRCKLKALRWISSLNCLNSVRGSISLLALGTSMNRVTWSVLPSSMRPCLRAALTPQWWDAPRNISRAAPTEGGESRVAGAVSKYWPLCHGQASQTLSAACHRAADAFCSWLPITGLGLTHDCLFAAECLLGPDSGKGVKWPTRYLPLRYSVYPDSTLQGLGNFSVFLSFQATLTLKEMVYKTEKKITPHLTARQPSKSTRFSSHVLCGCSDDIDTQTHRYTLVYPKINRTLAQKSDRAGFKSCLLSLSNAWPWTCDNFSELQSLICTMGVIIVSTSKDYLRIK